MKAKSRAVNMWDFTPGKKRVADVSTSSSHGMDTRGRKKKKSIVESPSNYSSTSAEDGSLSSGDLISDDELNERLAPVTADERKLYNSITAVTKSHEESEKIVLEFAHDKLKVKAKDMHRLSPNEWVDDLIIDTFGALINKRNSDFFSENTHAVDKSFLPISNSTKRTWELWSQPRRRTYIARAQLLSIASKNGIGYDYSKVKKWMEIDCGGKTIDKIELICLPLRQGTCHWVLIAIDIRAEEFVLMDSFAEAGEKSKFTNQSLDPNSISKDSPDEDRVDLLDTTKKWYVDEFHRQTGKKKDVSKWKVVYNPTYFPRQTDMHSCGIFVMYMMDYMEVMRYPDFAQSDAKKLRIRAALFIHNNALPSS